MPPAPSASSIVAAAAGAAAALSAVWLWPRLKRLAARRGEHGGGDPDPSALVDFCLFVQRIKGVKRTGWVREGVHASESVGDHMYSMGVMALVLARADGTLDADRCVRLALVHDLAEALVGDITPFDGVSKEEKFRLEEEAMQRIAASAGSPGLAAELVALWREYDAGETREARLVKDVDKLEMLVTAHAYEEAQAVDLGGFFRTTEGRIRHPVAAAMSEDLRQRRLARQERQAEDRYI